MCTIIVVNHHYREFPLVIAANRDEDYSRQSSPVQVLERSPLIIGGKDDIKGGTWLAVNKHSLFVGITNQGTKDNTLNSRGLFVLEALKSKSLDELVSFVEDFNPIKYNKFNVVFGNSSKMFIAHSYLLHSMVIKELSKGIHIISNDMKFVGSNNKNKYIHDELDDSINESWLEYYKKLKRLLASSDIGVKIKPKKKEGKLIGHCTRSSSILAFNNDGLQRYKFYDRTAAQVKKEDGKFVPRYKDYVDLWRNPDSFVESKDNDREELSEKETPTPKKKIISLLKKEPQFSKIVNWVKPASDYYDDVDEDDE